MKSLKFRILVSSIGLYINLVSFFSKEAAANIAIRIFKKPRNGKLKPEQEKYLKTHFDHNFISNGYNIACYRWPGKGPKILLLHGWESSSVRWKPYIEDLRSRGFDIYAIDAPAHGLSGGKYFTPILYADAISQIAKQQNFNVIVGHSVGAYATLIFNKRPARPESIKDLILLAPTGKIRDFMHSYFDILKLRSAIRDHYFRQFQKLYNQELSYYDSDRLIAETNITGLLIHDKKDLTLPYKDSVLIAKNWPEGQFVTTEGYGHRLKSTEVKRIIFNYLDSAILQESYA